MANDKNVTYIRYSFSLSDLLGGITTSSRYEIELSAQRYKALCEEDLKAKYPTAEQIEVIRSDTEGVLPASLETMAYLWPDFEEDPEEAEIVKEICAQIFNRSDWIVLKKLIPISDGYRRIHPSVLRWACVNELLQDAIKSSGFWEAPLNVLDEFDKGLVMAKADEFIITRQDKRILACFTEDIKDVPLVRLLEQYDEILVYPRYNAEIHLLAPDHCYFSFSKTGSTIQISIEHFIDVKPWTNEEWTYPKYAKALVQQAKRNGMDAEFTDGVVFRFRKILKDNPTVQILLKQVFEDLLVVVGEAEILLSGGPIWDKANDEIYKKDEDRFCQEILEPLLKKKDFANVCYTHGTDEFGRDFVFEYQSPFGDIIYFGLQAKKGDVKGTVSREISTIVEQITRGFQNSYPIEVGPYKHEVYISIMIVAISGEFTKEALQVIRSKLPNSGFPIGSVFFWQKPKILSLISQCWGRSKQ